MIYFEHFCSEHLLVLSLMATLVSLTLIYVGKTTERNVRIIVCSLSVMLFVCEGIQEFVLVTEGGDIIDFLPFHLCNIGIFVNLAGAFAAGKIQAFFAEVSLVLIMPGSLGALLFPDWNYRPFWSWLPMMCFFTHTLLVLIPLIFLRTGKCRVTFKHFWYSYAFLTPVVPLIYWFDIRFSENYMFLRYPVDDSPLEWIYDLFGEPYYIPGLIVLLTAVLSAEYMIYSLAGFCGKIIADKRWGQSK